MVTVTYRDPSAALARAHDVATEEERLRNAQRPADPVHHCSVQFGDGRIGRLQRGTVGSVGQLIFCGSLNGTMGQNIVSGMLTDLVGCRDLIAV